MTELSTDLSAIARNNERAVLRAIALVTAKHVCDVSGLSETQMSRMKDEKVEQYCIALAAMGLKLVPVDAEVVTKAERKFLAEKMIEHYQSIVNEP